MALSLPLIALSRQGVNLRLQTRTRFDDEFDLRFETADFRIGLIKVPLRLMHAVADGIVRLTHLVEFQFDMAQLRGLLFQAQLRFFDLGEMLLLLASGFVAP